MGMSVASGICLIIIAIVGIGGTIAYFAGWIVWDAYQTTLFPVLPILGLVLATTVILSQVVSKK